MGRTGLRITLASLLRNKSRIATLTEKQWDTVIPQARSSGLLARLGLWARSLENYVVVPRRPRNHLNAAVILAEKHRRDVLYELDRIREIIGERVGTIVLLKGAAYLAAGLPPSAGRTFNDIDILVPEHTIAGAEALLRFAGWRNDEIHPYDDRYYRRWMHQIPPLTHGGRQSTIDVHHSIVPPTARMGAASSSLLMQRIEPLAAHPGFGVLAREDMVLHSATHLFNEGEFAHGLRDLSDLHLLLCHFGTDEQFWSELVARAEETGLTRPLFYAVRHASCVFGTPVPESTIAALRRFAPPKPVLSLMDWALARALCPHHKSCSDGVTPVALFMLYVRAHYLRMPFSLLLVHLARKGLRHFSFERDKTAPAGI